jgi:hypothetical protein
MHAVLSTQTVSGPGGRVRDATVEESLSMQSEIRVRPPAGCRAGAGRRARPLMKWGSCASGKRDAQFACIFLRYRVALRDKPSSHCRTPQGRCARKSTRPPSKRRRPRAALRCVTSHISVAPGTIASRQRCPLLRLYRGGQLRHRLLAQLFGPSVLVARYRQREVQFLLLQLHPPTTVIAIDLIAANPGERDLRCHRVFDHFLRQLRLGGKLYRLGHLGRRAPGRIVTPLLGKI